jgi:hypothetical protein
MCWIGCMTRVEQVDPCASDAEQLGAYVTPTMQGSRNGMQIAAACASTPPPSPTPKTPQTPTTARYQPFAAEKRRMGSSA